MFASSWKLYNYIIHVDFEPFLFGFVPPTVVGKANDFMFKFDLAVCGLTFNVNVRPVFPLSMVIFPHKSPRVCPVTKILAQQ